VNVTAEKYETGRAYARNGNVGRETAYYAWRTLVDGEVVCTYSSTRREALALGLEIVAEREAL
jgi:hypothetical protein